MNARLEVEHLDIAVEDLDGLYTEHPRPSGVALGRHLTYEEQESLLVEAESFLETGTAARWGGREFFFRPGDYETMSRRRINNLRKTIEKQRPEWVEAIRDAVRASNNLYVIVGLAGLQKCPYPAVAIIENLRDRGELPEG